MRPLHLLLLVTMATYARSQGFMGGFMDNMNNMVANLQRMGDNMARQGQQLGARLSRQGMELGARLRLQGEELARRARAEAERRDDWIKSYGPGVSEFNTTDGGHGFVYNSPDGYTRGVLFTTGGRMGHGYTFFSGPGMQWERRW